MKVARDWLFWSAVGVVVTSEVGFAVLAFWHGKSYIYFYGTTATLVVLLGALAVTEKRSKH